MVFTALLISSFLYVASAQQPGAVIPEVHPALSWQLCTKSNRCQPQPQGRVVLDAEWRWVHAVDSYSNCVTGNNWDFSLCSDPATCAKNCALDDINYTQFGITTNGNSLTLRPTQTNYKSGSRVYLMANDTSYQLFKLKNQDFTFNVDVGNIPCGFGGGLYFVQIDADGGISKYPGNKAGAKYGTGYYNPKCPRNIKFINGQANILDWQSSNMDPDTGFGRYGTCFNGIDIWEANSCSTASIANPCTVQGQTRCSSSD